VIAFGCGRADTHVENLGEPPRSNAPTVETVDINSASVSDLEKVPHIGRRLAERIVAHRETYGRFGRPEELLLVRGMSEQSFREIRHLLRAE
jgi:competence protein ComEA